MKVAAYRIFAFLRLVRPDCAKPVGDGWKLARTRGVRDSYFRATAASACREPQSLVDNDNKNMFEYSHGVALASTFDII